MKISQLIIVILVLGLGAAGIKYSIDQQKVMDLLVTAHGGGPLVEDESASGLRKLNKDLEVSVADIAKQRGDALKTSESDRTEMRDARDKRGDAQSQLDADKKELDSWVKKKNELEARKQETEAALQAVTESLKSMDGVNFDAADAQELVSKIKTFIEEETAIAEGLKKEIEQKEAEHKKSAESLAAVQQSLAAQNSINRNFEARYRKNGNVFEVLSALPEWNVVVFHAGKDSGLMPGDNSPVLLKRGSKVLGQLRIIRIDNGVAVASYDPKAIRDLPQVGDTVFRKKPISE